MIDYGPVNDPLSWSHHYFPSLPVYIVGQVFQAEYLVFLGMRPNGHVPFVWRIDVGVTA
jgi:hypothetical protein